MFFLTYWATYRLIEFSRTIKLWDFVHVHFLKSIITAYDITSSHIFFCINFIGLLVLVSVANHLNSTCITPSFYSPGFEAVADGQDKKKRDANVYLIKSDETKR